MQSEGLMKKDAMPKKRHFLYLYSFISLALYFVITSFLEEGIAFFDPIYSSPMNNEEFFISFAASIVLGLNVIFLAHRYHKVKPSWVLLLIAILFFASTVFSIYSFTSFSPLGTDYVYTITKMEKIRQVCFSFAGILAIYILIALAPKMVMGSHDWDAYFFALIAVVLSAVIYSYITETQTYKDFFNPDLPFNGFAVPISYTNNRNTYGTLLLLGILASAYLSVKNHHWWDFIFALFFFLNEFVVMSKTTIIASIVFYGLFLIISYCRSVKLHPIKSNILLLLFLGSLGTIFGLYYLGSSETLIEYHKFIERLLKGMAEVGKNTFASRVEIWKALLANIKVNKISLIFGWGDKNLEPILGLIINGPTGVPHYAHNGFLDALGRFGLVGVAIYCAMLIYALVLIIQDFKHHHSTAFVSLLILMALLTHGFTEATNMVVFTSKGAIFLAMIFLPLLTDAYYDKKKNLVATENIEDYIGLPLTKERHVSSPTDVLKTAFLLITPFAIGLVGFSRIIFTVNLDKLLYEQQLPCLFDDYQSLSVVMGLWVLLPYLFYEGACNKKANHPSLGNFFYLLTLLYSIGGFALIVFLKDTRVFLYVYLGLGAFLAFLFSIPLWGKKGILEPKAILYSFIYLAVGTAIISINHYLAYFVVIGQHNRYAAFILIVLDFALYGFAFFASPLNKISLGSFGFFYENVERSFYQKNMHRHFAKLKTEEKFLRYQKKTPLYPD